MKKSDIQILIVEDDNTIGKALETAFQKAGYTVHWKTNSENAEKAARLHDFHCALIDCMIPGKNGLDLATTLNKEVPNLNIFLISGIFKDRQYIQSALQKTNAKEFLVKPFAIEDLIHKIDKLFRKDSDDKSHLNKLFGYENYSLQDRIEAINNSSPLNALDLPFVYSLLIDGKASGCLKIVYPESGESNIGFNDGFIDEVDHFDKDSYFGVLLVESGFISAEDLEKGLATQSNKRIGEKLVDINSLSPHAIHVVQVEQMKIRLSKTLTNASIEVLFEEGPREPSEDTVDSLNFSYSLNDWILSKFTTGWLSSFYRVWYDNPISLGTNASKFNLLAGLPVLKRVPFLMKTLEDYPCSLNDLIAKHDTQEEEILQAIHLLLLKRIVFFSPTDETRSTNHDIKRKRLQKIYSQFKGQNYFEILGLSTDARSTEVNRAYHELAKALHPDKIGPKEPSDIKKLSEEIFAKITEAYQTLKDNQRRKEYVREVELGSADEILKLESDFNEGQRFLFSGKYKEAHEIFREILKSKGARSDTPIFYCWAKIKGRRRSSTSRDKLTLQIKSQLDKVPHEDRHSKYYFYVKGLYYNLQRNYAKAYNCYKHSLTMDPQFKDARRELSLMKRRARSTVTESTFIGKILGINKKKSS